VPGQNSTCSSCDTPKETAVGKKETTEKYGQNIKKHNIHQHNTDMMDDGGQAMAGMGEELIHVQMSR